MFHSISAKLLSRMLIVSVIGLVIGLGLILKSSADLRFSTAENLTDEKREQTLTLVKSKIDTALSTVLTLVNANPGIGELFVQGDYRQLHSLSKQVAQTFSEQTDHRGLSFVAFDKQNHIFMRSFAKLPDKAIGRKAPRDFSALLSGQVKHSAEIDLSGVGLFVTASVPVRAASQNNAIVGVLDMRSGLGSVVREMLKEQAYFVAVLNEKGRERWAGVAENPALGSYHLAHSTWFKDSAPWFAGLPIDDITSRSFTLTHDKAITSTPILNSHGDQVGYYLIGIDMQHPDMVNAMQGVNHIITLMLILIVAIIAALMGYLWWSSRQIIRAPIQTILHTIQQVAQSGKMDAKISSHAQDEVGEMTRAFGSLLEQINQAINEANTTVSAIANGDFTCRMQGQYQGDLARLKTGINQSAQQVAFMMDELASVMKALQQGQFDVRMSPQVAANFRQLVEGALNTIEQVIREINQTLSAMQQGDFSQRVQTDAQGELAQLKNHVNESLSALEAAMAEINRVMNEQANGNLTQRIQGQYQGALNQLKEAINASSHQLNKIVTEAMAISAQVNGAAQEVSRGALDLSERVQQQAASVEQTSATMEQMNSSVQHSSQQSQQAAAIAQRVQQKAQKGNEVMAHTIEAMSAIQDSSHKISDIVSLIDGIAFQTNLLALNAAVEAARAGEHGRGFAVVAGEVRALAQKSADAAKDITTLIHESVTRIDQGTQLASESGEVLNDIIAEVAQVAGMIEQIAHATAEQAHGIQQVHLAINQIDAGTQQNAALVEQTSAAAESLTEQAGRLRDDMARFRVEGQARLR
ncbi:MAG: methyl-accepting chemotaxis protein [Thiomicrospira sp.]